MFDFYEKRKIRSLLYSKFLIVFILALVVLLSTSVYKRYTVEREMSAKRESKEEELQALNERAAALESKVQHLEDERGIEEELRSRFDVAKDGEQVVVIVDQEKNAQNDLEKLSQPPGKEQEKKKSSFWSMFKFW